MAKQTKGGVFCMIWRGITWGNYTKNTKECGQADCFAV
jgi:hypothetical protein